jgi:hypothetical protein
MSAAQSEPEEAPEGPWAAVFGGEYWLSFRYRFEDVDQRGFSKDAHASTLRTVLGYETLPYHGLRALVEFEDVRVIGDDTYNSTLNGRPLRPIVLDPENTELNQAYLAFGHGTAVDVRLGRQRIKLDNDRFIGNVGWRQNEQTYDALSVVHSLGEVGELFLAFLENVNTIFGESAPGRGDAPMSSGLLNASLSVPGLGTLVGYWYHLDFDRMGSAGLSTSTIGARLHGEPEVCEGGRAIYTAEYARQTDAGSNPNDVEEGYYHLQLGGAVSGVELVLGREVLEGSGKAGEVFTTPLATLHAHNGWADKFLTPLMPTTGLEDVYVSAGCSVGEVKLKAAFHEFTSEQTSAEYGRELDVSATMPIGGHVVCGVKFASYMERGFATDTEKAWFWVSVTR